MDLPTYTNIWRIEKRLYKLYDFNLPMPLPMVQIGVFIGVFVPWVVFLQLVQVPFQQPWHVLYLVPPGLVTYLATRPVLEGKRLTELLISQTRYIAEPRTWCRLTPVYEPERATVVGTVWHRVIHTPVAPARHARRSARKPRVRPPASIQRVPPSLSLPDAAPAGPPAPSEASAGSPVSAETPARTPWPRLSRVRRSTRAPHKPPTTEGPQAMTAQVTSSFPGTRRIVVLGCSEGSGQTTTALMVGHALALNRRDRPIVVDADPGERSLSHRSRMETPETLSSLLSRIDSVSGYLGLRAYTSQAGSGLEVVASDEEASTLTHFEGRAFAAAANVLDRYYKVSLYDTAEQVAPRVLPVADQVLLVASAHADAAGSVDAALERMRQHGYAALAADAVLVLNDVHRGKVEQARASVAGRRRETLTIPWDGRLNPKGRSPVELDDLHAATHDAYMRLAGSLVTGFARPGAVPVRYRSAHARQEVSR